MMNLKRNLAILCLSNSYARGFGKKVADFLDLFFVDIEDILEYNLVSKNMLETAGREYFEREKQKVIDGLSQYENSLFVANLNTMLGNNNILKFKKTCVVLYLKLEKNHFQKIEEKNDFKRNDFAFKDEDEICKKYCDIMIEMTEDDKINLERISNELINYFGGQKQ